MPPHVLGVHRDSSNCRVQHVKMIKYYDGPSKVDRADDIASHTRQTDESLPGRKSPRAKSPGEITKYPKKTTHKTYKTIRTNRMRKSHAGLIYTRHSETSRCQFDTQKAAAGILLRIRLEKLTTATKRFSVKRTAGLHCIETMTNIENYCRNNGKISAKDNRCIC